jgi:hypothetical protein
MECEAPYRALATPSGLPVTLSQAADIPTGDYRDHLFAYVTEADLCLEPLPAEAVVELAAELIPVMQQAAQRFRLTPLGAGSGVELRKHRPEPDIDPCPHATICAWI